VDEEQELLIDFRTESFEHISEVEPLFLEIEEIGADERLELVNRIFRAVHSVKGAAGFFGLDGIQELSHAMENLLMRMRDGELGFHPAMTDALLAGLDKLSQLVEALPERADLSIAEEVARIAPLIAAELPADGAPAADGGGAAAPDAAPRETAAAEVPAAEMPAGAAPAPEAEAAPGASAADGEEPVAGASAETLVEAAAEAPSPTAAVGARLEPPSAEKLAELKRFGKHVHHVELPPERGVGEEVVAALEASVGAVGEILSLARVGEPPRLGLLFASVLEPDLLAGPLGVEPDAVRHWQGAEPSGPAAPAEAARGAGSGEAPAAPGPAAAGAGPGGGGSSRAPSRKAESSETIRVNVELLDKLMNLAGELVLGRNQLLQRLDASEDSTLKALLQNVDLVTSELQSNIMNTRMQPVGSVFKKLHRVVRDLSRKLWKQVELELEGTEVELDKSIIELLSDPLTHLVRNSLDHGLETRAERVASGKEPTGRIVLSAFHEGGQVNIEIRDDGRGIDPEKTRRIAVERELMSREEAEALSHDEAVMLIFAAGFSTASQVTGVSGRGVGMDVVKSNITKLGGKIEVDSALGRGTTMRIRLPLTLAIIPSLIVGEEDERFAVPQVNLVEIVRVKAGEAASRLERLNGADVLRLRGNLLPLVMLAEVLDIPRQATDPETGAPRPERRARLGDRREADLGPAEGDPEQRDPVADDRRDAAGDRALHVLVLRVGDSLYGLVVDHIHDSEEIVVKPLSQFLKGVRSYAGATIMGDGRVAMILDVGGIAAEAGLRFQDSRAVEREERGARRSDGTERELILFANACEERFAVDLDQVVRLERIETSQIERIGDREYVQHLGRGLPLVRLEDWLPVNPIDPEAYELYVLIPKVAEGNSGILASRVIDTVEASISLDRSEADPDAVSGRAVLQGRLTTFLDAARLVRAAQPGGGR